MNLLNMDGEIKESNASAFLFHTKYQVTLSEKNVHESFEFYYFYLLT